MYQFLTKQVQMGETLVAQHNERVCFSVMAM